MKLKLKRFAMSLFMSALCVVTFAQKTITGKVVDSNGEPIIGASIVTADGTGTVTNFEGVFTLNNGQATGS